MADDKAVREAYDYPDDRLDAARYRALVDAAYAVTVEVNDPSVGIDGYVDVSFDFRTAVKQITTLEHLADALLWQNGLEGRADA